MDKLINDYKEDNFTLKDWIIGTMLTMAAVALCIMAGVIE